jgi:hypothetical protein
MVSRISETERPSSVCRIAYCAPGAMTKMKRGRKPLFGKAMTGAERQARYMRKLADAARERNKDRDPFEGVEDALLRWPADDIPGVMLASFSATMALTINSVSASRTGRHHRLLEHELAVLLNQRLCLVGQHRK